MFTSRKIIPWHHEQTAWKAHCSEPSHSTNGFSLGLKHFYFFAFLFLFLRPASIECGKKNH